MKTSLQVINLGKISYDEAYRQQLEAVTAVINGAAPRLIICEHPAVITLGRMFKKENLLFSEEEIKSKGVELRTIDRGGDVTLHSPGQLVVYPILNLTDVGKDLHHYMHQLEAVGIALVNYFGINAGRDKRNTGLWIGDEKIMAIGIGVKKWVSYHGLALNVNNDLDLFSLIRPCGLNAGVTSMAKIKGRPLPIAEVQKKVIDCFCQIFQLECAVN